MKKHLIPFLGALFAALSVSAFTPVDTDFTSGLPASLGSRGKIISTADGATFTTTTAKFNRSYVCTTGNDYLWASGSVTCTFTLDTFTNTEEQPGSVSLFIVGNETEGDGKIITPDYTPAAVLGVTLVFDAPSGQYNLVISSKTERPRAGFNGKSFRRLVIKNIASVNLGTFGFTISSAGKITPIVNGIPSPQTYTLKPGVAEHFSKAARVYLAVSNSNKGQPATFKISNLTIE